MPGKRNQDGERKAYMEKREMRHVSRLSASLSEVCDPVWEQNEETRAIPESGSKGLIPMAADKKETERLTGKRSELGGEGPSALNR